MNNLAEIMKIIEGGLKKDSTKVLNYSLMLIQKLESEGDIKNAQRLRNLLSAVESIELKPQSSLLAMKSPVDPESRVPLAECRQYRLEDAPVILPVAILEDVNEFVDLLLKGESLASEGIKVYRSLLLYGPPGTGKTQTAKYISAKTSLPLITVRIDGLVSSYLGSTSKNIRALFDFVERTPCILFLDEFDAIAKMRDDSQELGELKRVVNTLLQNLDSLQNKVPIIAATNHEHLLDSAVWRRFDYKIALGFPNTDERAALLEMFLGNYLNQGDFKQILNAMTQNMSGAEIEMFSNMVKTTIALRKIDVLDEHALLQIYLKCRNRGIPSQKGGDPRQSDEVALVKFLRERDPDITIRTVAKLLNVATSTAHEKMKG